MLNMGQAWPLLFIFVLSSIQCTKFDQNSVDGVVGIRTETAEWLVADLSTELLSSRR